MENNEEYVTISLQGYTKQSGLNRGRSPRYVGAKRLPEPTVTDQREVGPRTSLRLVEAYSLLFSNMLQRECLFPVYRLAFDVP